MILAPRWTVQTSGVSQRLRGVSAVNEQVAWASGAGSTILRTEDGGLTWQNFIISPDNLDFRDIDAVDAQTAYVMSIGNGPASRIYKTTADGRTWSRVPATNLPPAQENEGAFAASGTNIALFGKSYAWIGTGAAAKSRVLRTTDGGRTWRVADTPLASGPSAGIFSIAFRDAKHGVVAGGDYRKEPEAVDNLAVTSDGGVTWTLVKGLSGFRSVVAYVPGLKTPTLVALGP